MKLARGQDGLRRAYAVQGCSNVMVASTSMAIEPVEQQDDFGRPRKLQEIDQTGKMIYKE